MNEPVTGPAKPGTQVGGSVDDPVAGSHQPSTPHILTEEDIQERTPQAPPLGTEHTQDADGTDVANHGPDPVGDAGIL